MKSKDIALAGAVRRATEYPENVEARIEAA